MGSSIITIIVVLAIIVLFFYVLRSGMLWYWKIDVMSKNLEDQTKIMHAQKELLERMYLHQKTNKDSALNDSREQVEKSKVI